VAVAVAADMAAAVVAAIANGSMPSGSDVIPR
jgi:hypothetical protein